MTPFKNLRAKYHKNQCKYKKLKHFKTVKVSKIQYAIEVDLLDDR